MSRPDPFTGSVETTHGRSPPLPGVAPPTPASAARVALVIAVAHGVNDAYAAFLHPLLPRIMERLDLSIALAATLAMTLSIAASLLQPLMGYVADVYGRRALVVFGPLASGVFLSLIGVAPNVVVLVVLLALGGIGSAAFHPPAASLAARVSAGGGSGARLSIFSFGGAFGYALGPLAAVGIVAAFGLERLWVAMLPAIAVAAIVWRMVPADPPKVHGAPRPPTPAEVLRMLRGPLGVIFGVSAVFAFVQRVFLTMEPIIVAHAGGSEALGALSLSVYLAGQAAGTLAGGFLTDRMDRRRLLLAISILAVPLHLLALGLPPATGLALAAAAAAGLLNMMALPPIVVMAQEMMPAGAAVGSGIVMGLAWALGSVAMLATGALGDVVGAQAAALLSVPVGLVAVALVWSDDRLGRRAP